jgi:hypothetical protein
MNKRHAARAACLIASCAVFIWALIPVLKYENLIENSTFAVISGESFSEGWHFIQPHGSKDPFRPGAIRTNAAGVHRYWRELTVDEPGHYEMSCTYRTITNETRPVDVQIHREGSSTLQVPLGQTRRFETISHPLHFEEAGTYTVSLGTLNQGINGEIMFRKVEIKPAGSVDITDVGAVASLLTGEWKLYAGMLLLIALLLDLSGQLKRVYGIAAAINSIPLRHVQQVGALSLVVLYSVEWMHPTSIWNGFSTVRSHDASKDRFFNGLISNARQLLPQVVLTRHTEATSVIFDESGILPTTRVLYLPYMRPRLIVRWEQGKLTLPKGFDPGKDPLFRDGPLLVNYVLTNPDKLDRWTSGGNGHEVYRRNSDIEVFIDDLVVTTQGEEIFRESFEGEVVPTRLIANPDQVEIETHTSELRSSTGKRSLQFSIPSDRPWSYLAIMFSLADKELSLDPDFQVSFSYWTNQLAVLTGGYQATVGRPGGFYDDTISYNPSYLNSNEVSEWGMLVTDAGRTALEDEFMNPNGYKWDNGLYLEAAGFMVAPIDSQEFVLWKLDEPVPLEQLEEWLASVRASDGGA